VPNDAQAIKELSVADKQWLERARRTGTELLTKYDGVSTATPAALDKAFRNWKRDKSATRATDQDVASGFGVLFGNYIVKHKDCRWVVLTDASGTDLALESSEREQMFPISTVWKRIDPSNEDMTFFEPIWTLVADKQMKSR
jgi:hypothetical protein